MRTLLRRIARCTTPIAILIAAAIAGCRDQPPPVAPTRQDVTAVPRRLSFDLAAPEEEDIPVADASNDSGSATLTTTFPSPTLVQLTVSGMITQTSNATQVQVQFGPAGLAGSCGGLVVVSYTGGSWWHSSGCTPGGAGTASYTDTIGVKGTVKASRGPGPTGYTYSGDQTFSVAPIHGDLGLTVNRPVTYAGDFVSFHASAIGNIPAAFWGVTEWKWIPDAGSPVIVCVNYGPTCTLGPTTSSGVMQMTGQVNGEVKTKTMRLVIQCMTSGPSGDSAFLRMANDTLTRKLLKQAWDSSNANGSPVDRHERIGQWGEYPDSTGIRFFALKDTLSPGDTPCKSVLPVLRVNQSREFVILHTHPFANHDPTPSVCHPDDPMGQGYYSATKYGGPSAADYYVLQGLPGWGVIGDSTSLYVFHTPPTMTFAVRTVNGEPVVDRVTSDWRPYVRSYPRNKSSCPLY
jgi:hypothetical protein